MEHPLTFVVRSPDGQIIDAFTEEDLASFRDHPDKTWHEAACWAYLAMVNWRRTRNGGSTVDA